MANYTIKVIGVGAPLQKSPRQANYCTWKCPFCHGNGINPYGKSGAERCPSCHGHRSWEADVSCDTLASCGRCAGTGRINYMGNWELCNVCKGSGKV